MRSFEVLNTVTFVELDDRVVAGRRHANPERRATCFEDRCRQQALWGLGDAGLTEGARQLRHGYTLMLGFTVAVVVAIYTVIPVVRSANLAN